MFAWPFYDARFWLPAIPLLIAYSLLALNRLKAPKTVLTAYCVVFATLGLAAIAYCTRITFAGPTFPDRYGDGSLRPAYCAAYQSCRDYDVKEVNFKALRLLQQYK